MRIAKKTEIMRLDRAEQVVLLLLDKGNGLNSTPRSELSKHATENCIDGLERKELIECWRDGESESYWMITSRGKRALIGHWEKLERDASRDVIVTSQVPLSPTLCAKAVQIPVVRIGGV